jgi:hypothetical protein
MPKYTDNDIDEDMKLTRGDYLKILHHYQPRTRKLSWSKMTTKSVKERAHRILAEKLCRCLKKVSNTTNSDSDEGRRIAYCTRSIFKNRCIQHHGFRCKSGTRRVGNNKRPRLTNDLTKTCRGVRI